MSVMRTMMMNQMQMHRQALAMCQRICCCCSRCMMRNDKNTRDQHIINLFKERQTYEEDYFYDSVDFRVAA